jgi:hypothetical protein
MASLSGAPGSSDDHVAGIKGEIKSTILPPISEGNVLGELSRSAAAPVSQLVENEGGPLSAEARAEARAFGQSLMISE